MKQNGIVHVTSAPYHPATNGLAEKGVQTRKQGLQKVQGASMQERLSKFLFKYRLMPHPTTGVAPCELLMGRKLRSCLDLVFPDIAGRVQHRQEKQKVNHDNEKPLREFQVSDSVYVQNFIGWGPRWLEGTVVKIMGSRSYSVELKNGMVVRRHIDSIRSRVETDNPSDSDGEETLASSTPTVPPTAETEDNPSPHNNPSPNVDPPSSSSSDMTADSEPILHEYARFLIATKTCGKGLKGGEVLWTC